MRNADSLFKLRYSLRQFKITGTTSSLADRLSSPRKKLQETLEGFSSGVTWFAGLFTSAFKEIVSSCGTTPDHLQETSQKKR